MSDIVIKVENLSKQYQLGLVGTGTLRRDLQRWYSRIRGKEDPTLKIGQENVLSSQRTPRISSAEALAKVDRLPITGHRLPDFVWALKDINFEVKQGEVLGIIGKNWTGKSTENKSHFKFWTNR
jgi:lipopolysaccharide transport system ATP-binding protein